MGLAVRGIDFAVKGIETMRKAHEKEVSFDTVQSAQSEGGFEISGNETTDVRDENRLEPA